MAGKSTRDILVEDLEKMGVEPFAQPYRDFDGGEPTNEQKRLARWCNMRAIHKTVKFEDYQRAKMEVQDGANRGF